MIINKGNSGGGNSSDISSVASNSSPSGLIPPQWEDAPTEITDRCVAIEFYGDSDTGRTTLAFTAPLPIAYIHAYEKRQGLIQQLKRRAALENKRLSLCSFRSGFIGSPDTIQRLATTEADKAESCIFDAFNWARSIIVDTHPDLWSTYQLARLGTLSHEERNEKDQRKGQLVYSGLNSRWSAIYREFSARQEKENRTNLIFIGKTGDEYRGKEKTGRTVRVGHKDTLVNSQVSVRTYREDASRLIAGSTTRFYATVEKPWWNADMRGKICEGEYLTFPWIMAMITNTTPDDWAV